MFDNNGRFFGDLEMISTTLFAFQPYAEWQKAKPGKPGCISSFSGDNIYLDLGKDST